MAIEAAKNYGVRPACVAGGTVVGGGVGYHGVKYLTMFALFSIWDNPAFKHFLPSERSKFMFTLRTVAILSLTGAAAGAIRGASEGNAAADRILKKEQKC